MRFKEYLKEAQNLLTLELDYAWDDTSDINAHPALENESDVAKVQAFYDRKFPGLTFEVISFHGPGAGWPNVNYYAPPKVMEQFLLWYTGDDEDSAEEYLDMCEKVVR